MFDTIPAAPSAIVDVPLDPHAALGLAAQALAAERPLATTFKMSKVVGEVTGQQQNGFAYRTHLKTPMMRFRMNDGYVTAAQTGPNATRLQIHENKRYPITLGIITGISVAAILIVYLVLTPSKTPWELQMERFQRTGGGFNWSILVWVAVIAGLLSAGAQIFEMIGLPQKLADKIRQGIGGGPAMATPLGAPGGFPAQAPAQPGFAAAPQQAFAPPAGNFAAPPQQGFPAPPQQGFPAPPQAPQGFPAPQPPQGFPAPPQQQGGYPAEPAGFPAAAAPQPSAAPEQPEPAGEPAMEPAIAAQIEELGKLRDGGIITDADYDQARAAILAKRG